MSDSCSPMNYSLPGSSVHGNLVHRQEYWSGLPFPSPGDPLNPEIEPRSPSLQAVSLLTELQGKSQLLMYLILFLPSHFVFSISWVSLWFIFFFSWIFLKRSSYISGPYDNLMIRILDSKMIGFGVYPRGHRESRETQIIFPVQGPAALPPCLLYQVAPHYHRGIHESPFW